MILLHGFLPRLYPVSVSPSQMQHTFHNLRGSALVEEVGSQVPADPAAHIHFPLVPVAASGAFPDQFAVVFHDVDLTVKAAHLAVVALGVQLSVHDMIVNETHHRQYSRDVGLEIRNLHIGDGTARRQRLELRFKAQLAESIDGLGHMSVIAIRYVVLICHMGNDAEAPLQALGKLVGA